MADLDAVLADVGRGMIPAHIYSDQGILDVELDRIFGHTWVFVAHESEVPGAGDYVVRRVAGNSFIVVRDEAGRVRVHFNMCLHKGMQVCRAEVGNASHFRCPYHGWSYRNDGSLAGLPFHAEAYGGDDVLPRTGHSLLAPAAVDSYNGLVFVNLDEGAPPLRDHLGEFAFYLDLYAHQSDEGLEFHGPQRWRIKANWKIGCENFVGDMYHTPYTHQSIVDIGLFREPRAHKRKEGVVYFAGRGGGTTYKLPPGDFREKLTYVGYPDEMVDRMQATWSDAQRGFVEADSLMVSAATLFPNLSIVHNWPQIDESGVTVPFISFRQWMPISATETEVVSWFAVDRAAPDWFKAASSKAYIMCFGSSGMFEQDDVENWVSITEMSQGSMAHRLRLNSRMGLGPDDEPLRPPLASYSAPGVARVGFGEFNQRSWLDLWSKSMAGATR